nr:uncharacterized mitochondrial protein AtMg00810-like [Tanacetum cinerariifolium]
MGYFARKCRGPRNQDSRNKYQDSSRRTVHVEETPPKAMVAIDGVGFDWSYMADDEVPTNTALMAFLDYEGHPIKEDQGYVDSGCSRHTTGNMSYRFNFKEFDEGYVTFREGAKGGKITGKGTLKTGTEESIGTGHASKVTGSNNDYILMPLWKDGLLFDSSLKNASNNEPQPSSDDGNKDDEGVCKESGIDDQERPENSTQDVNTAGPSINTARTSVNTKTRRMTKTISEQGFISAVYEGKTHKDLRTYLFAYYLRKNQRRPDIMFAVCACARFQVTPKVSHLYAVKRIFRYLKGQPKLGLWYPKDSPFELEAYTDSDYAGASLDMKSTTGGCQFLRSRLISFQCKKQTMVANSTTNAEYVAAASCCGQILLIQNQILDYGYNFMNTKIFIDNENTICIVKNPVFHSKTKHIEL